MAKAKYIGKTEKHDTYWHFQLPEHKANDTAGHISVRIRKEITDSGTDFLLTYKHKERIFNDNGAAFEVNDEKECTLSDTAPLESLLEDTGFFPAVRKDKTVYDWETDTPCGKALLELCTVPPLGDFLEIEILSQKNDEKTVASVHAELKRLLEVCNIPLSEIEPRYYTDMLREAALEKKSR